MSTEVYLSVTNLATCSITNQIPKYTHYYLGHWACQTQIYYYDVTLNFLHVSHNSTM